MKLLLCHCSRSCKEGQRSRNGKALSLTTTRKARHVTKQLLKQGKEDHIPTAYSLGHTD